MSEPVSNVRHVSSTVKLVSYFCSGANPILQWLPATIPYSIFFGRVLYNIHQPSSSIAAKRLSISGVMGQVIAVCTDSPTVEPPACALMMATAPCCSLSLVWVVRVLEDPKLLLLPVQIPADLPVRYNRWLSFILHSFLAQ